MIAIEEHKQKLRDLGPVLTELEGALDLSSARAEMKTLEAQTQEDGFWNDLDLSKRVNQKLKQLQDRCAAHQSLYAQWEDLTTLCQLALEEGDESLLPEIESGYEQLATALETMRLSTLLSGEYDHNNAIISLHAGAGGTEAQDWCYMLFRMLTRWAERRGFAYKTLDMLDGDEAGLKSCTFSVEGENAFGYLKSEMGVHRLVRISPFDSSGRRHTSFAAVEVMPEIEDEGEIPIRDEDLKVDTYRSGGAGGQHVNKTESAIRITHVPSGIVVACQNERSQFQNRDVAMRMLRAKLAEIKQREHMERIEDIKGVQKNIEWGSQIRSYVFMPYTLAKDHRTGFENGNITAVMDGDLDGFMAAYLKCSATGQWATK